MHACRYSDDAETSPEARETFAVKVVDLRGVTLGEPKKLKNGMAMGAESGLAGVGDDGEWKVAGLPRRAERVAAELEALRRLHRRIDSGTEELGGDGERSGRGEDGSAVRILFPAVHDFFIHSVLETTDDSTTEFTNASNAAAASDDGDDAGSSSRGVRSRPSSVVCHTVMTRCPGGKDLLALLAAAPGPGIPESQARFYTAEVGISFLKDISNRFERHFKSFRKTLIVLKGISNPRDASPSSLPLHGRSSLVVVSL